MAGFASSPVPRVDTNAIVSPPGENVGLMSAFGCRVRRSVSPRSRSVSHTSWFVVFSAVSISLTTKASRFPSRDQVRSEKVRSVSASSRR